MDKLASELGDDSPEQLMALLEHLQGQEGLENASPDLAELLRNVKREKGERTEEVPTEEIEPEPGFVVKTQDVNTKHKVFINMCGHPRVAAPGNWEGGVMPESVQNALDNVDNLTEAEAGTLRFPLSMSTLREDVDKKGEPCTTLDCCLNNDVIAMASKHRPLKSFLIELAVSWVSHKHKMELDMKFKLPKMRYKGEVVGTQRIRVDKKPLVSEVKDVPEEPTFPLRATKAAPPEAKPQLSTSSPQPHQAPQSASRSGPPSSSSGTNVRGSGPAGPPSIQGTNVQPATGSLHTMFKLLGKVECHGRPVQSMSFAAELPPCLQQAPTLHPSQQQQQQVSGSGWTLQGLQAVAGAVRVEVCGRDVFLGHPGYQELQVPLPFAASSQNASVTLEALSSTSTAGSTGCQAAIVRVQLQYASLSDLLAQAVAQKPHQYGQLGLANTTALELED
ncbi:pre-RNA processing PIH1/Nop17-domain-containing protein [Dunaliella salina]|uniref:Pre-RNA processing PIH1/Nop17-domain-containing protein n=1 Tax=Dunaliella salina TaxID=3046 RepID=A0ABQ7G0V2_DUNSA|nr:pre-RNA processing PIH1/Nop17-domain-containing protein [Dunaliella salina]|eukprot:KAF5828217.1 pre-RNA processing PIH1/Nop17-domain-containing protein [Dunaliella salina]